MNGQRRRRLITKAEYDGLNPYSQGYAVYWEADQPGSELKGLANPYAVGTPERADWNRGAALAAQNAQDSEE